MERHSSTGNYQTLVDKRFERQDVPYKKIEKPDYIIEKGSHIFMLEVPDILSELIKNEAQRWV
ncbi:MAG: hypothetical protein WD077_01145 [Bacteroidia bacterium]